MLKTLAKSIRENKKNSILTPIFVLFEVIIECIIPFIIAITVNRFSDGCSFLELAGYGGILAALALLSLLFGSIAGVTCARASCGFAKNLRADMYYNIQTYSFENIDRFSTSSLVTRLTTDVSNLQNAYMMLIRIAVRSPFMFVFAFVMAFVMGGRMAWIFVGVVPILAFGLFLVIKSAMPIFRKVFKKYDRLNESVQENVKGMRVVKSFVREDYEKEKFSAAATDVARDFTKAERILALNSPIMQFCLYCIMIFVLTYGSYTVISSKGLSLDVGQFSSLLTYGMMILTSLMMLSMIFVTLTMSAESARRICEVLNEKSTLKNPENPLCEVKDGSIVFENVSFKYSDKAEKYALKDVNLTIKSGETIGIIGGTGSSKSTLVSLVSRLYDVKVGRVLVGGCDVRDYDLEVLRNAVGTVLQKNVLFSGTIKENLRWGKKDATDEEIRHAAHLARADEFIEKFPDGYETHIEQGGANVSGGQRQRLCIARALLKSPKILIMDDSTSALDTRTDAEIRKNMSGYIPNTTKIIVAQRIQSVESADRIIVMDGGKIVAFSDHKALLSECEIYRDIYTSQTKLSGEGDENV